MDLLSSGLPVDDVGTGTKTRVSRALCARDVAVIFSLAVAACRADVSTNALVEVATKPSSPSATTTSMRVDPRSDGAATLRIFDLLPMALQPLA
jgi:hypothetical protein